MGDEKTTLGGIHISPNAVATIAYYATLQSYGVVGLAPKNLADGIRINSVAESVANTVRFHVEKALGLRVNSVNVHVAGLRISDTD